MVAFIVLGTSLVTGRFFLVKIYIENQLGIKEKEMLKEYQEALDKQTKEQNVKFSDLENKQNERFTNLENGQKKILDWIKSQKNFNKNSKIKKIYERKF